MQSKFGVVHMSNKTKGKDNTDNNGDQNGNGGA